MGREADRRATELVSWTVAAARRQVAEAPPPADADDDTGRARRGARSRPYRARAMQKSTASSRACFIGEAGNSASASLAMAP